MLALLIAASVAAAPADNVSPYFLDASTTVQMVCNDGFGTAFYVGNHQFVTAKHVVLDDKGRNAKCMIGGKPTKLVEYGDGWLDYAVVTSEFSLPNRAIISCAGFKEGDTYFATGYAGGNPWPVTQRLIGTSYQAHGHALWNRTTMLRGGSTEGQSGGPVSDDDGRVVGIVSHGTEYGITEQLDLSLSDTPICKRITN